jgi:hypothetical protein
VTRGGREGGQQSTNRRLEIFMDMRICGSVYTRICRTVGKRSTFSSHSLMAPRKEGPADTSNIRVMC